MNEKELNQLTSVSAYGFAVFCMLWVILTYAVLPVKSGQEDYSLMINSPGWSIITVAGLLASLFGIFTVFGIFNANKQSGGVILFVGCIILVLGLALEFASLTWDLFIWPVICAHENYVSIVKEGVLLYSVQFTIFFVALMVFLFFGTLFTSVGLWKTKKYGKLIPIFLIAGILLYATGNFVTVYIATVGLALYSLAFVLIGLKIGKEG